MEAEAAAWRLKFAALEKEKADKERAAKEAEAKRKKKEAARAAKEKIKELKKKEQMERAARVQALKAEIEAAKGKVSQLSGEQRPPEVPQASATPASKESAVSKTVKKGVLKHQEKKKKAAPTQGSPQASADVFSGSDSSPVPSTTHVVSEALKSLEKDLNKAGNLPDLGEVSSTEEQISVGASAKNLTKKTQDPKPETSTKGAKKTKKEGQKEKPKLKVRFKPMTSGSESPKARRSSGPATKKLRLAAGVPFRVSASSFRNEDLWPRDTLPDMAVIEQTVSEFQKSIESQSGVPKPQISKNIMYDFRRAEKFQKDMLETLTSFGGIAVARQAVKKLAAPLQALCRSVIKDVSLSPLGEAQWLSRQPQILEDNVLHKMVIPTKPHDVVLATKEVWCTVFDALPPYLVDHLGNKKIQ